MISSINLIENYRIDLDTEEQYIFNGSSDIGFQMKSMSLSSKNKQSNQPLDFSLLLSQDQTEPIVFTCFITPNFDFNLGYISIRYKRVDGSYEYIEAETPGRYSYETPDVLIESQNNVSFICSMTYNNLGIRYRIRMSTNLTYGSVVYQDSTIELLRTEFVVLKPSSN